MIRLHNGDCLEAMREMKDNEFDLAIVDPPYGIGKAWSSSGGNSITEEMKDKIRQWDSCVPSQDYFDELQRVSKNQIIWGGNYFFSNLGNSYHMIVWDKKQRGMHFSDGEMAWTSFRKKAMIIYERSPMGTQCHGAGKIHPTQKPIALYTWLLSKYAKEGDKILDTHLGSGSIAIACHNLGFALTGYELDSDYFAAAKQRLEDHQKQLRLF